MVRQAKVFHQVALFIALSMIAPLHGWPQANAESKTPLRAELLADTSAVAEGEELWLGVYVRLEPEWHIYWQYPGDSGFATKIDWQVEGLTTHSLTTLFPVPQTFTGAGGVVSYGYSGETLLLAHVPRVNLAPAASEVKVTAKARWLLCRDEECRDGKDTLEIKLPVGRRQPTQTALFERFRKLLPPKGDPGNLQITTKSQGRETVVELTLTAPKPFDAFVASDAAGYRGLAFYPLPPKGLSVTVAKPMGALAERKINGLTLKTYPSPASLQLSARRSSRATTGPLTLGGVVVQQWVAVDGTVSDLKAHEISIELPSVENQPDK